MIIITYINIDDINSLDNDTYNKIKKEVQKKYYLGITKYLYKNEIIDKNEFNKIKDIYESLYYNNRW